MYAVARRKSPCTRLARNEAFFDTYTAESCYWAGFLAADGNLFVVNGRNPRLSIALAVKDAAHLEAFRCAAGLAHSIRPKFTGTSHQVVLAVNGVYQWFDALTTRFNITPRKSLTLQPPPDAMPEEMRWHFLRGYFDGDGCASGAPGHIAFTSGSLPILEWARTLIGGVHTILRCSRAWMYRPCGRIMRDAVRKMYAGSTPATRLGRKYHVLVESGVL